MAAGLFVLQGCGDDVVGASLTGSFSYSVSNLQGSGQTCSVSGMTLNLTQEGTQLTGTTTAGTIVCTGGSAGLPATTIVNGSVNGSTVLFGFQSLPAQHNGTLSGNTIAGTVNVSVPFGPVVATLSGQFTATRQ